MFKVEMNTCLAATLQRFNELHLVQLERWTENRAEQLSLHRKARLDDIQNNNNADVDGA